MEEEAEEIRQWHLRDQQADHFMVQAVAVALAAMDHLDKKALMAIRALYTSESR